MKFEKNRSPLDISINEEELTNFISQHNVSMQKISEQEITPDAETIQKFLPKFIAKKIEERIPDGFELTELEFTGEIEGKPFNIGFSGSVTAIFTKNTSLNKTT